ncbi:hypothetical protein LEP1GSC062_1203 [Leptospira alexanderi serovar Manhao 3 str. L 60]|uniref:PF07600 domain protein n=1 Tax=Leptospira alexanderi serovar Manhao 3 str. L 60 TaxID=1049759 RepID=V6HZ21_9LEPT|nr:hypothetical protein LEP1GSC062_1203 [Leptospira alexanderi serovar Manhao 3 str. L 60]
MYQRDRGKMIRMNLRIDCKIWALLGVISAHGVSRCFMVNYLLWLDDSKRGFYRSNFECGMSLLKKDIFFTRESSHFR